ncbi:MAG: carboxypeptidase regulatory-like domain-containing protein [Acidobacteria bacterium]|nr:carboxypeptidase regulatory-like domain-containing protein [Acidobacteriota bacterium]
MAQIISGNFVGVVRDSSQAAVAGAAVAVRNDSTNFEYKAISAESGDFVVPNLPPGTYTITVEHAGFK